MKTGWNPCPPPTTTTHYPSRKEAAIARLNKFFQESKPTMLPEVFDVLRTEGILEETCLNGSDEGDKVENEFGWNQDGVFGTVCKELNDRSILWCISPQNKVHLAVKLIVDGSARWTLRLTASDSRWDLPGPKIWVQDDANEKVLSIYADALSKPENFKSLLDDHTLTLKLPHCFTWKGETGIVCQKTEEREHTFKLHPMVIAGKYYHA